MTAPRTALFQRKGSPSKGSIASSNLSAGKPGAQDLESGPPPVTPPDGEGDNTVTCPECGCQFDPSQVLDDASQQGQMPPMGDDSSGGGDLGAKIAAMMQGGGSQ